MAPSPPRTRARSAGGSAARSHSWQRSQRMTSQWARNSGSSRSASSTTPGRSALPRTYSFTGMIVCAAAPRRPQPSLLYYRRITAGPSFPQEPTMSMAPTTDQQSQRADLGQRVYLLGIFAILVVEAISTITNVGMWFEWTSLVLGAVSCVGILYLGNWLYTGDKT